MIRTREGRTCLLLLAVLAGFVSQAAQAQNGCGLAFLTGTTPTVNGSIDVVTEWRDASKVKSGDPCLESLAGAPAGATLTSQITLTPAASHEVVVYSKRASATSGGTIMDNLFLALDIDDATPPAAGGPGEVVILHIDPNNSGHSTAPNTFPQTADYRLKITYFRGSPGADSVEWCQGAGSAGGDPWPSCSTTLPAGLQVSKSVRSSGDPGYQVEIKIPLSAIGYTLSTNPSLITDIGMAIAVENDNGFQADVPALGFRYIVTGVAFPTSTQLSLGNLNDPLPGDVPVAWDNPGNWGEAFLTGAGQMVHMLQTPETWLSDDIRPGFCNTTSFDDVGTSSSSNPKWYRYKKVSPCNLRPWARVHRRGTGVGVEQRRVLFLWAHFGMNQLKWHYVHLTDPISLPAVSGGGGGTAGCSLAPGETNATVRCTPGSEWTTVPANNTEHPCLKAFVLPASLKPGVDAAFFANIGSDPTENPDDNSGKLTQIRQEYGLASFHEAQMNISVLDSQVCPACVPIGAAPSSRLLAFLGDSAPLLAQLAAESGASEGGASAPTGNMHGDPDKPRDLAITMELYGVAVGGPAKNYAFVEPMGGVKRVINLDYLKKIKAFKAPLSISNSKDAARELMINSRYSIPSDVAGVRMSMAQPRGVVAAGQTLMVQTEIKSEGGLCPSWCGPCKNLNLTRNDGSGWDLPGALVLAGGIAGVGGFAFRKRRRRRADR